MQRIEVFLQEGEVPDWAGSLSTPRDSMRAREEGPQDIGFTDASFNWPNNSSGDETPSRFQLGPLTVLFPSAKLSIISGPTGSGKSALLAAILGGKILPNLQVFVIFNMLCFRDAMPFRKSPHRQNFAPSSFLRPKSVYMVSF